MKNLINIGVVNFETVWGDKEANLTAIEKYCEEAGEKEVNLLLFPETALNGYLNEPEKKKAEKMSKKLEVPYIYFAKKPFKFGFNRAKKIVQENSENIAVIGDQILTDVLGANRSHMYSILVEPLAEKDIFVTRFNRLIERQILKKYKQK